MLASLRKARESEVWKGLSDVSVVAWIITSLIPVIAALAAWFHHEPLHQIILYFCIVAALSTFVAYHLVKFREHHRQKQTPLVAAEAQVP